MTNKDGTNPNTIANIFKKYESLLNNTKTQQYVKSQIFIPPWSIHCQQLLMIPIIWIDKILENILAQQDNTEFNDATHTFWTPSHKSILSIKRCL